MSGVYVHIPFCKQSCIYCNFYFKTGLKQSHVLTDAIIKEIDLRFKTQTFRLETIYFGGGTPSYLDPELIQSILQKLIKVFGDKSLKEITLEVNPDDMSKEKLQLWRSYGISRLSVGIQSFYQAHLKWMNRAHTVEEAELALKNAIGLGFELSLDLIFGLPNCTDEQWKNNIEKACSYPISHLSCYGLTLEDNTPWRRLIDKQKAELPDEAAAANQFNLAMAILKEKGWQHYEISNYCLPGKMAIHNTSYWLNKPYVGIGPSAHSFDGNTRSWNVADINNYIENIESDILPETHEHLSKENKYNEYIMTSLRTQWGIDQDFLQTFDLQDNNLSNTIKNFKENGMINQVGKSLILSDNGKLYADAIATAFFVTVD